MEQFLCVNEQMCSTKARNQMKRYLPNKPHKWGYKLLLLSGISGFCYKFEFDTGKENIVLPQEPDLGAASNCVIRLAREIPKHQNYRLYFDNYFTSLPLLKFLADDGILALGTIRHNRITNGKLYEFSKGKKMSRGTCLEYVTNYDGVDISLTSWMDNKVVRLASNYAGIVPKDSARRFDRQKKEYIEIERPYSVSQYNSYMGGVDLIDSIIGRYKISIKSQRWQVRVFYHLLDLTVSNAWLLYKRVHKAKASTDKLLNSADFRLQIAEALTKLDATKNKGKRGSGIQYALDEKKLKGPSQQMPNKMVRQDQFGHWPVWTDKRLRCKYPNCTGFSKTQCDKCGVFLCFNKRNNCFKNFHLN